MLRDMLERRLDYARKDGERFFDAAQNARVVADAERYYRAMYYGSASSWNLRDTHMFDTLQALFSVLWAATRGASSGSTTPTSATRAPPRWARAASSTSGSCAATTFHDAPTSSGSAPITARWPRRSNWDEPMQRMRVRPAHPDSYERLFHDSGVPAFTLHLRAPRAAAVRDELVPPRLERAIGVVYRPDTELASHYFYASLPHQFDELVWFDETRAVKPLPAMGQRSADLPETYPFGL